MDGTGGFFQGCGAFLPGLQEKTGLGSGKTEGRMAPEKVRHAGGFSFTGEGIPPAARKERGGFPEVDPGTGRNALPAYGGRPGPEGVTGFGGGAERQVRRVQVIRRQTAPESGRTGCFQGGQETVQLLPPGIQDILTHDGNHPSTETGEAGNSGVFARRRKSPFHRNRGKRTLSRRKRGKKAVGSAADGLRKGSEKTKRESEMLKAGFRQLFHPPERPQTRPAGRTSCFRKIELAGSAGVDDRDALKIPLLSETMSAVGLMDMAVNNDRGAILMKERFETLKAPVSQIRLIPDAGDGGMGEENVEAAGRLQLVPEVPDSGGHLLLREHGGAAGPIAHAAAQPEDPNSLHQDNMAFGADAALGGPFVVMLIMIAVNIDDRSGAEAGHIAEVGGGEIPGGKNQIRRFQGFPAEFTPETLDRLVRESKNVHQSFLPITRY